MKSNKIYLNGFKQTRRIETLVKRTTGSSWLTSLYVLIRAKKLTRKNHVLLNNVCKIEVDEFRD